MITYFCPECKITSFESECRICGSRTVMSSKLYWCHTCNVPVYSEHCPVCGGTGEYFTTDARPVFPEERLLIECVLGEPMKYHDHSVWNSNGTYYVDGKRIKFSIDGLKNTDINNTKKLIDKYNESNSYDYFNNNIEKFILANRERFSAISSEAMNYIVDKLEKRITKRYN